MCLKIFRIICVLISLAIMISIFSFSTQEASESANTSKEFISKIAKTFTKDFETLPIEKQEEIISNYQFLTRKTAHFSLFLTLGFFVLLSVITYEKIKFKVRIFISFIISTIYAASDEIHQLFVAGRSGEVRDFFIDVCGCVLGIVIGIIVYKLFLKIKGRNSYVKKEIG